MRFTHPTLTCCSECTWHEAGPLRAGPRPRAGRLSPFCERRDVCAASQAPTGSLALCGSGSSCLITTASNSVFNVRPVLVGRLKGAQRSAWAGHWLRRPHGAQTAGSSPTPNAHVTHVTLVRTHKPFPALSCRRRRSCC